MKCPGRRIKSLNFGKYDLPADIKIFFTISTISLNSKVDPTITDQIGNGKIRKNNNIRAVETRLRIKVPKP